MAIFTGFQTKLTVDMTKVRRALVMVAIEKTLLEFGKPTYNLVIQRLEKEYHSYVSDCYEHPNYLQNVLKELFGKSSDLIIGSITKNLSEFSDTPHIREFLDSIAQ